MNLKVLLFAVAVTSLPITARAQSAPTSGTPLVVTNLPFTAQEWTTATHTRSDGTTVQSIHRADLSRNTAGSTRRDARILAASSTTAQPTGSLYIDIHDVPNFLTIHLDPSTTTATVNPNKKSIRPYKLPVSIPVGAAVSAPTQNLGLRSIAGFTATGSRQTFLFPTGTKSHTQDVTQTTDTWYSPDLKIVLLTQTSDTLNNSVTTAISQIVQGEPDPTLFTVPQNYTQNSTTTTSGTSAQSPQ